MVGFTVLKWLDPESRATSSRLRLAEFGKVKHLLVGWFQCSKIFKFTHNGGIQRDVIQQLFQRTGELVWSTEGRILWPRYGRRF